MRTPLPRHPVKWLEPQDDEDEPKVKKVQETRQETAKKAAKKKKT